jgi:polyisoprenoid-binding protein YceI
VVNIDAKSVFSHEEKRDKHLSSADFFDIKQFPQITFKSDSVKKNGDNYDVKGQLTLHGVTKPIAFTLHRNRTGKDPMGSIRTGGEAEFKIKRSDFGMNFMVGPDKVGDEVSVLVSLEGTKQ